MKPSDRIEQRKKQLAKMTEREAAEYLKKQDEDCNTDSNYELSLKDDSNWAISESESGNEFKKLIEKADTGDKRAMYDVAAVFAIMSNHLRKENDSQGAFLATINSFVWAEEARKAI